MWERATAAFRFATVALPCLAKGVPEPLNRPVEPTPDTLEAQAELLARAFESGDPATIAKPLGAVAKAHGMSKVAREADLDRSGLYKALSDKGDPHLSTLLSVAKALGFRVTIKPLDTP